MIILVWRSYEKPLNFDFTISDHFKKPDNYLEENNTPSSFK
jgi:hypothetical protein